MEEKPIRELACKGRELKLRLEPKKVLTLKVGIRQDS